MNQSTVALIAAAIALSVHAAGQAQSAPPPGAAQAQQGACVSQAELRRQRNREHAARLRKAKANLVAAAFGSHRGRVPEKAPPTQLACNDAAQVQARTAGGG